MVLNLTKVELRLEFSSKMRLVNRDMLPFFSLEQVYRMLGSSNMDC